MNTCVDYAEAYRKAMLEIDAPITPYLVAGQYVLRGNRLLSNTPRPLQPNTRLIAETIWQLKPGSLAEFGSGCGVNLYNISQLLPKAKLYGYELCQEQINVMREVFPNLDATVWMRDITRPNYMPGVDVALSHVVLMHLDGCDLILAALQNMLRVAQHQVVLLENWASTDFVEILREAARSDENWQALYLYTRRSPELKRAHIVIASKTPLTYTPLLNYEAELAAPVRENWTHDAEAVYDRTWENA